MNIFKNNFLRNANESLGQTLMEFALLLLLIACVVILSVALVGKSTSNGFNNATDGSDLRSHRRIRKGDIHRRSVVCR